MDQFKRTTFGTAARGHNDLPKANPSPSHYRPIHFTEASHAFSIPRAPNASEKQHKKDYLDPPGPGQYSIESTDMANLKHKNQAKSMAARNGLPE